MLLWSKHHFLVNLIYYTISHLSCNSILTLRDNLISSLCANSKFPCILIVPKREINDLMQQNCNVWKLRFPALQRDVQFGELPNTRAKVWSLVCFSVNFDYGDSYRICSNWSQTFIFLDLNFPSTSIRHFEWY